METVSKSAFRKSKADVLLTDVYATVCVCLYICIHSPLNSEPAGLPGRRISEGTQLGQTTVFSLLHSHYIYACVCVCMCTSTKLNHHITTSLRASVTSTKVKNSVLKTEFITNLQLHKKQTLSPYLKAVYMI